MGLLSPELKKGPCVLDQIVRDDTEKKGLVRSTVSTHLFRPDLADKAKKARLRHLTQVMSSTMS